LRYSLLLFLVACAAPPAQQTVVDAGSCAESATSGLTLIAPMSAANPPACLDGHTGAWVKLSYASSSHPGSSFVTVGVTVYVGDNVSGVFTSTSDFTSSKDVTSATDAPANIWVDLSAAQGTKFRLAPYVTSASFEVRGHNLPIEDLVAGQVKSYEITLE
jgi:hypothetical protein